MENLLNTSLTTRASFLSALSDLIPGCDAADIAQSTDWLSQVQSLKPPRQPTPVIDLFTMLLTSKLAYEPQQRDLVILHHEIVTARADGSGPLEIHSAALEAYGSSSTSAMALCVGLPVAIAALQILDGKVMSAGVQGPTNPVIYEHILEVMQARGMGLTECSKLRPKHGVGATLERHWA